jgi:hypothetical protein
MLGSGLPYLSYRKNFHAIKTATIPFGSDRNTAAVSFIGPLGFGRQINRTDTATAIGDTAFSASLGWQQGEHYWNMTLTGVAPTGEYNDSSLAIMGLNRPAVDLKGAYTFLSLKPASRPLARSASLSTQ